MSSDLHKDVKTTILLHNRNADKQNHSEKKQMGDNMKLANKVIYNYTNI